MKTEIVTEAKMRLDDAFCLGPIFIRTITTDDENLMEMVGKDDQRHLHAQIVWQGLRLAERPFSGFGLACQTRRRRFRRARKYEDAAH